MEMRALAALVCAADYGLAEAIITPLSSSPGAISHSFLVALPAAPPVVLHAYRPAWAEVVAPHETVATHVAGLAALLAFLGQHDYPAPRPLLTNCGALTVRRDEWHLLMTAYVEGTPADYASESLRGLGLTVGRLHRLPLPTVPIDSWWALETVVPMTLERLRLGHAAVPVEWRSWYDDCRCTLEAAITWVDLPRTIIHADAWTGNALITAPGQLTLIDWECAGCGPAALDLGSLILHAHYDVPDYAPDSDRLAALLAGYCAARQPTTAELAVLPQAVQFGPAFRSALFFFRAQQRGWGEWVERHLTREAGRFSSALALGRTAQALLQ